MQLSNLKQAPFNTTMMGAMRGALDYYGIPVSDAVLYGASGHAFVLNIHRQLCPSGPYCWDRRPVDALLANVGLRVECLGFFHAESSAEERSAAEGRLREALASGTPCSLTNMENQLITGCDDTGFLTAQPWPCTDFPPRHLTFATWSELGTEIHMDFHVLHRAEPADLAMAVADSLRYAVDLWRNPKAHSGGHYGMGPEAYANWKQAVLDGHGASHGAWWNGTVWSECRARAADYFREVAPVLPSPEDAQELGDGYAALAALLERCADKAVAAETKVTLLAEAQEREEACIARIEALLVRMA
ncbi:MAG TPA: hypothetical protein VGN26_03665 [Armatimonadota bacterium]|jgi:hypothetical protein